VFRMATALKAAGVQDGWRRRSRLRGVQDGDGVRGCAVFRMDGDGVRGCPVFNMAKAFEAGRCSTWHRFREGAKFTRARCCW
jgi:hypothetical protein